MLITITRGLLDGGATINRLEWICLTVLNGSSIIHYHKTVITYLVMDLTPGAAGYRISNPPVMLMCPMLASLDVSI